MSRHRGGSPHELRVPIEHRRRVGAHVPPRRGAVLQFSVGGATQHAAQPLTHLGSEHRTCDQLARTRRDVKRKSRVATLNFPMEQHLCAYNSIMCESAAHFSTRGNSPELSAVLKSFGANDSAGTTFTTARTYQPRVLIIIHIFRSFKRDLSFPQIQQLRAILIGAPRPTPLPVLD